MMIIMKCERTTLADRRVPTDSPQYAFYELDRLTCALCGRPAIAITARSETERRSVARCAGDIDLNLECVHNLHSADREQKHRKHTHTNQLRHGDGARQAGQVRRTHNTSITMPVNVPKTNHTLCVRRTIVRRCIRRAHDLLVWRRVEQAAMSRTSITAAERRVCVCMVCAPLNCRVMCFGAEPAPQSIITCILSRVFGHVLPGNTW